MSEIIHAEHLFGQKQNRNLTAAYNAVNFATPYDEMRNHFLCFKYAVQEMRLLQKKREKDLDQKVWEMAAMLEKQVDTMAWSTI